MKCKICGKEFARRRNEVTCGKECARLNKNLINRNNYRKRTANRPKKVYPKVNCRICGKEFIPNTPIGCLCGDECRAEAAKITQQKIRDKRPKVVRVFECKICGKEFEAKSVRQKCCSKACSEKNKRILQRECERNRYREIYKSPVAEIDLTPYAVRVAKASARQAELERKARSMGLSYGQFQAWMSLPEKEKEIYLNSFR